MINGSLALSLNERGGGGRKTIPVPAT